jgi:hypothetical protein
MSSKVAMWLKLGLLIVGTTGLLLLLFAPTQTVKVKLDLPPGAPPSTADHVAANMAIFAEAMSVGIFALILLAAAWIGWRIVRHHRKPA